MFNPPPVNPVCRITGGFLLKRTNMNERIVALDIGDVRIGIAVSDPTRTIASPVEVITRVGWGPDTRKIRAICDRYETNIILSGLPLNMDGSEGFQAAKVRDFCAQLEKAGLTVLFQDERLSTVSAEDALLEGNLSRSERKKNVDKVAAAVFLQQWLDAQ
jgi:putative Holliday junction resolvase